MMVAAIPRTRLWTVLRPVQSLRPGTAIGRLARHVPLVFFDGLAALFVPGFGCHELRPILYVVDVSDHTDYACRPGVRRRWHLLQEYNIHHRPLPYRIRLPVTGSPSGMLCRDNLAMHITRTTHVALSIFGEYGPSTPNGGDTLM